MKLTFIGAARTVTGSMHRLESNGLRAIMDCGLYQGPRKEAFRRNREINVDAGELGAVLLSHAHIDHSGNLPTLVKRGFRGTIYATGATRDLCGVMLPDSGFLQERDVEYVNKRRRRMGKHPFEPLYTAAEAREVMPYFQDVSYEQPFTVGDGLEVVYHDAGHILGSAMIEVRGDGPGGLRRVVYSGDIGRPGQPILRNPWPLCPTDALIMESTYGNRRHEGSERIREKLLPLLRRTVDQRGKLVIPAFSVGRTQHLVHLMSRIWADGGMQALPVYVDSPLSVNATDVFRRHPECYDDDTVKLLAQEKDPFGFSCLTYIRDLKDSKALNNREGPMVIISASGMCEGGRVLHHLANTVGEPRNTILFIGFQAEHTLGRRLVEGATDVKIYGERHTVRAAVESINAFSAHADQEELLAWLDHAGGKIGKIFLVHGEEAQAAGLTAKLAARGLHNVIVPHPGQSWEI